jgi:hypothetical protein
MDAPKGQAAGGRFIVTIVDKDNKIMDSVRFVVK